MLATVLMLLVAFQDATTYKISISPITVTVETVTTPAPDPEPEIPTPWVGPPEVVPDPNAGWTVLTPSADSRMIYVSSSTGNDVNDGLTEATPKQTISAGVKLLRNGYPDWMRLKHGDTFAGNVPLEKCGRSNSEHLVVSGYGEGDLPIISGRGFTYWAPNMPAGFSLNHISIIGINFSGTGAGTKGIFIAGPMNDILIEGNSFSGYELGIDLSDLNRDDEFPCSNITIRRNTIFNNSSQGLIASGIRGMLLEENVFDHNGFDASELATVFNHNAYIGYTKNMTARNNIFSRASNFGLKMASNVVDGFTDFVVEDNLFYNNGISMDSSSGVPAGITTFRHQRGVIKNNVFTEIGRTFATGSKQDMAAWLLNTLDMQWDKNCFVHKPALAGNPMMHFGTTERHENITITNSVVYDWILNSGAPTSTYFEHDVYNDPPAHGITNLQLSNNEINLPAGSYVDPTRTVGSYYASIGGTNDSVAFVTAARGRLKANWSTQFTASAVNKYIRSGFTKR